MTEAGGWESMTDAGEALQFWRVGRESGTGGGQQPRREFSRAIKGRAASFRMP